MKRKPRSIASRAIAVSAVAVIACAGLIVGLAQAAFASGGVRAGDAIPINPATLAAIPSGGSATAWTLRLPAQAACSGDTANQGYHVYSFLVPTSVDPSTLTFNPSTGPSSGFPLVDTTGSAYLAANTATTTGQVIQIPNFNFNLFATTDQGGTKIPTPPGNYRYGIACANTNGQADKYWDREVSFTASNSDPNGETWAAFASGVRAGESVAIDPHTVAPLPSGGSATAWTLNLPGQAACSGDTANQGYHVYSFLVPTSVNPAMLTFNPSTGPSSGFPLITNTGSAYLAVNTASVTGQVVQIPTFDFSLFATTDQGGTKIVTPPGTYRYGIASANTNGQPDKYWDAPLTFTADGGDPNGETWSTATLAGAPSIGTATGGSAQATVSWTAPGSDGGTPITAYVVTPFIGAAAQTATTFNNTGTTETVSGLTNGTTYTFKVAAINGVGTGPQSAASNAVTPATLAGAPTIGTAVAGMAQATVSWTAPTSDGGSSISGYVVTPFVAAVAQPATTFNNTATTETVSGLTNGTTYTFTVAAINGVGTGPQSGSSNTAVPGIAPDAPTIGTAVAGMGQATVSWTAPVSNGGPPITTWVVTAYDGFTPVKDVIVVGQNVTSRTVPGLTNGTTYRFRVRALNAAGSGPYSKASNTAVPGITPDAPTIGSATAGNAQATVSWTAPASNGGPPITTWVVTAYVGFTPVKDVIVVGQNVTSRTVTGLSNGTTYRFRVRAVNAAGSSDYSKASNPVAPVT